MTSLTHRPAILIARTPPLPALDASSETGRGQSLQHLSNVIGSAGLQNELDFGALHR